MFAIWGYLRGSLWCPCGCRAIWGLRWVLAGLLSDGVPVHEVVPALLSSQSLRTCGLFPVYKVRTRSFSLRPHHGCHSHSPRDPGPWLSSPKAALPSHCKSPWEAHLPAPPTVFHKPASGYSLLHRGAEGTQNPSGLPLKPFLRVWVNSAIAVPNY